MVWVLTVTRSAVAETVMFSVRSSPVVPGSFSAEDATVVLLVIVPAVVAVPIVHVKSSVSEPAFASDAKLHTPVPEV